MITMYYDDSCTLCTSNAHTLKAKSDDITIVPVSTAMDVLQKAGYSQIDVMTYVVVSDDKGRFYHGMEAVRLLYTTAHIPFAQALYLPVIRQCNDFIYPYITKNRHKTPR